MSLPIKEKDPILPIEFSLVNQIGKEITHLIKVPQSNGLYAAENPLFEELLEIIRTVEGKAPVPFKREALRVRMYALYDIVGRSKDGTAILSRLKFIHECALSFLSDNNRGKKILIPHEYLVQTKSMLPAFPSKKRTIRSKEDIDWIIRILWGGITVLYAFPNMNDDLRLEIFKSNFRVLIRNKDRDSDSFTFEVLEKMFILNNFVENIFQRKREETQKKQTRTTSNRKISTGSTSVSSFSSSMTSSSFGNKSDVLFAEKETLPTIQKKGPSARISAVSRRPSSLSDSSCESSVPAPLLPKDKTVIDKNMAPIESSQTAMEVAHILQDFSQVKGGKNNGDALKAVVSKKRKKAPVKVAKTKKAAELTKIRRQSLKYALSSLDLK